MAEGSHLNKKATSLVWATSFNCYGGMSIRLTVSEYKLKLNY